MTNRLEKLTVFYHDKTVGLLRCIDRRISFIYDKKWLLDGFSISPRSLPLENRVFTADSLKYQGLFGVFADSLPDGWGTLTTIKYLRNKGISYLNLNPLEKLSLIGEDGLGALSYRPSQGNEMGEWLGTLDEFFQASLDAVEGEDAEFLDTIFAKESSTGGARPKAHVRLDGSEWIVKFREEKTRLGWDGWNMNITLRPKRRAWKFQKFDFYHPKIPTAILHASVSTAIQKGASICFPCLVC